MKTIKLVSVLALCIVGVRIALGVAVAVMSLDGLDGMIFGLLGEEDTLYAPGYSDSAFRQIAIDTTEDEVLVLLGEPVDRYRLTGALLQDWSRAFQRKVSAGNIHTVPAIPTFACATFTSRIER
jgi:hypothetical protein